MNYKLEKFWNIFISPKLFATVVMNYKLEKFWNKYHNLLELILMPMNYKLEKFWNKVLLEVLVTPYLYEL